MTCQCGKPSPDSYLCTACTRRLINRLGNIPGLWMDSLAKLPKAQKKRVDLGFIGDLPLYVPAVNGDLVPSTLIQRLASGINWAAFSVRDAVGNELTTWARDAANEALPAYVTDVPTCARFLANQASTGHIGQMPQAWELAEGIGYAYRILEQLVDRPADLTYVGKCECGEDLWSRPDQLFVKCHNSECTVGPVNAEDHRAEVRVKLREYLATAAEIGNAKGLGFNVADYQVSRWVSKGQLVAKGRTEDGRHDTYRVGDVLDLDDQMKARRRTA